MSETNKTTTFKEYVVEEYVLKEKPFYLPLADEVELFKAAYKQQIPVILKGPTGCGKTRFVEYMAYELGHSLTVVRPKRSESEQSPGKASLPLVTIACHEDLTASDLVGRYLLEGDSTRWIDGPLTRAVKAGGICYMDEIVEARKDTTVVIHPLSDHRRILPVEKKGQVIEAHPNFLLVISYNPGYQSAIKELKHSTKQRFIALEFGYPPVELETRIIQHESGIGAELASELAKLGQKVRNLKEYGLEEGVSTRLLIYAARLIKEGIPARRACQVAVVASLSDESEVRGSIEEIVSAIFS